MVVRLFFCLLISCSWIVAKGQYDSLKSINSSLYIQIADEETSIMMDSLGMSEQQLVLVSEININYFRNIAEMSYQGLTPVQRKKELEHLAVVRNSRLNKYMTTDQFYRYQIIIQKREDRMKRRSLKQS